MYQPPDQTVAMKVFGALTTLAGIWIATLGALRREDVYCVAAPCPRGESDPDQVVVGLGVFLLVVGITLVVAGCSSRKP